MKPDTDAQPPDESIPAVQGDLAASQPGQIDTDGHQQPAEPNGSQDPHWGLFSSPWWRLISVMTAPRATFVATTQDGRGFGLLFVLLGLEFVLVRTQSVAGAAFKATHGIASALLGLWSSYVNFALATAFGIFCAGVVLYYAARRQTSTRLDIWAAASVLAYAYGPHVLITVVGVVLAAVGVHHDLLPQIPLAQTRLPTPLAWIKAIVVFGPTGLLMGVGASVVLARPRFAPALAARSQAPLVAKRVRATAVAGAVAIAVGLGASAWSLAQNWNDMRPIVPKDALPDFTLEGLDGARITRADLADRVVLIDFWATWCPPCVAAMPTLAKLEQRYQNAGFFLLAINVESETPSVVQSFMQENSYTFPVYFDDGRLQRRFSVQSYPTSFLVDRRGVIRHVHIGPASPNELHEQIAALIKESDRQP